jgi:hypothetical protein
MKHLSDYINKRNALFVLIILGLNLQAESQTTSDGSRPQFLFPGFSMGKVKMKNGSSQSMLLNYNTVSEKMVYEKDKKLYDMINTESYDTIFLQKSKFVPVGKVFHEVLVVDTISLFIQHKGTIEPPGKPAGYGGPSQVSNTKLRSSVELSMGYWNLELPKDYIVKADPVFWIRKDDNMFSFATERQFLKIFPDNEEEYKLYIKQNKIKFDRLSNVVKLIEHCNEITK